MFMWGSYEQYHPVHSLFPSSWTYPFCMRPQPVLSLHGIAISSPLRMRMGCIPAGFLTRLNDKYDMKVEYVGEMGKPWENPNLVHHKYHRNRNGEWVNFQLILLQHVVESLMNLLMFYILLISLSNNVFMFMSSIKIKYISYFHSAVLF